VCIPSSMATKLWSYCKESWQGSSGEFDIPSKLTLESVFPLLNKAQHLYITLRESSWTLLLEVLRIDQDDQHVYHKEVQRFLSDLFKASKEDRLVSQRQNNPAGKDEMKIFYKHIESLYGWETHFLSPKSFQAILSNAEINAIHRNTEEDVNAFSLLLGQQMASLVAMEVDMTLDAMLLMLYSRHATKFEDLNELSNLTESFRWAVPKEVTAHFIRSRGPVWAREHVEKFQSSIQGKYIILFAECLQLWRFIPSGNNSSSLLLSQGHPLLDHISSHQLIDLLRKFQSIALKGSVKQEDSILSREKEASSLIKRRDRSKYSVRGMDYLSNNSHQGGSSTICAKISTLLFCVFICASNLVDSQDEYVEILTNILNQAIEDDTMIHLLEHLTPLFMKSNQDFLGLYASVVYEIVNALVAHLTLMNPDSIIQPEPVIGLLKLVFTVKPDLSEVFWKSWHSVYLQISTIESEADDESKKSSMRDMFSLPLSRLMYQLWKKAFHLPSYFFQLLQVLIASPAAADMALSMLHDQMLIVSDRIPASMLRFYSSDANDFISWEEIVSNESRSSVEHKARSQSLHVQLITASSKLSLTSPIAGQTGMAQVVYWESEDTSANSAMDASIENISFSADRRRMTAPFAMRGQNHASQNTSPRFLVIWQESNRVMWWSLIVEILLTSAWKSSSETLPIRDELVESVLQLLTALFKNSSAKSYIALTSKVEEWFLFRHLSEIGLIDLYPMFSMHNISIKNMRNHPEICRRLLIENLRLPLNTVDFLLYRSQLVDLSKLSLPYQMIMNLSSANNYESNLLDLLIQVTATAPSSWCELVCKAISENLLVVSVDDFFKRLLDLQDERIYLKWNKLFLFLFIRLLFYEHLPDDRSSSSEAKLTVSMSNTASFNAILPDLSRSIVDSFAYCLSNADRLDKQDVQEYFVAFHLLLAEHSSRTSPINISLYKALTCKFEEISTLWFALVLKPAVVTVALFVDQNEDTSKTIDPNFYANLPYEECASAVDLEMSYHAIRLMNWLISSSQDSNTGSMRRQVVSFFMDKVQLPGINVSSQNPSNFVIFTSLIQICFKLRRSALVTWEMREEYLLSVVQMLIIINDATSAMHNTMLAYFSNFKRDIDEFLFVCVDILLKPVSSTVKSSIILYFITCAKSQRLFLAEIFQVPFQTNRSVTSGNSSDSQLSSSENTSILQWCLTALLSQTDIFYNQHPRVLNLLLHFLYEMSTLLDYSSIQRAFILMITLPKFWEWIGFPIMQDLDMDAPIETDEKVSFRCHQLQCHRWSLQILAWERYIQLNLCRWASHMTPVHTKVDNFLQKANESRRFLSWTKKYVSVVVEDKVVVDLVRELSSFGLKLEHFLRPADATTSIVKEYGDEFIFRLAYSEQRVREIAESMDVSTGGEHTESWGAILEKLKKANCIYSIVDCKLDLLRSWKRFLLLYIQPKRKDSTANANEGLPDWNRSDLDRSHSTSSEEVAALFSTGYVVETPPDSPSYPFEHQPQHSPHMDAFANPSPSSLVSSSFVGDKRSYEMATEVLSTMMKSCQSESSLSFLEISSKRDLAYGWNFPAELSDLFLQMLHHQLRAVRKRTNDPRFAYVEYRSGVTGNPRFSSSRMVSFFEGIFAYHHLYFADSTKQSLDPEDVVDGEKLQIRLNLLNALLLLVRSVDLHEYGNDKQQEWLDIYREAFQIALQSYDWIKQYLVKRSTASQTPIIRKLVESCLRLMKDLMPDDQLFVLNPNLCRETIKEWRSSFHTHLSGFLSTSLKQFFYLNPQSLGWNWESSCRYDLPTCVLPSYQFSSNSCTWKISSNGVRSSKKSALILNKAALSSTGSSIAQEDEHARFADEESMDEYICLFDLLDALIRSRFLTAQELLSLDFFSILARHPLMQSYQRQLQQQENNHALGLYFAYGADSGRDSTIYALWDRFMNMMLTVCEVFDSSRSERDRVTARLIPDNIVHGLVDFFSSYEWLLTFPLKSMEQVRLTKLSIGEIQAANKAVMIFVAMQRSFPAFQAMLPQLYEELSTTSYAVLQHVSYLLWEGEDYDEYKHQEYVMFSTGAAISDHELRMIASRLNNDSELSLTSQPSRSTSSANLHRHVDHHTKLRFKDLPKDENMRLHSMDYWNSNLFARTYEEVLLNFFANLSLSITTQVPCIIEGWKSAEHHPSSLFDFPRLHDQCANLPIGSKVFYSKTFLESSSAMATTAMAGRSSANEMVELSASRALEQMNYPSSIAATRSMEDPLFHTDILLQGVIVRTFYDYTPTAVDILLPDGTLDRHVEVEDLRSSSFPLIQFHPLIDLSTTSYPWYHAYRHFITTLERKLDISPAESFAVVVKEPTKAAMAGSLKHLSMHFPRENFVSTACLLKSLQYAVSSITSQRLNSSNSVSVSNDLFCLASRLAYLILQACVHHARFIMDGKLYSWPIHLLLAQFEDLLNIVQGRGILQHQHAALDNITAASSRGNDPFTPGFSLPTRATTRTENDKAPDWMMRENWQSFVEQLVSTCNLYIGELHQLAGSPVRGGDAVYWKTPYRHDTIGSLESKSKPKK
jgi:hypothetical protein